MKCLAVAGCIALAGCAQTPVAPSAKLLPPPAWAMEPCPPLPPIPEHDGTGTIRARHYGAVRSLYAECADRNRVKNRWITAVAK